MKTNLQIANEAVKAADAIYAGDQTKSSEYTIKLADYRNTVVTNLSPDVQVKMLLEDAAKAICQTGTMVEFDQAVDMLEAYSTKHNLDARI